MVGPTGRGQKAKITLEAPPVQFSGKVQFQRDWFKDVKTRVGIQIAVAFSHGQYKVSCELQRHRM